MSDRFLPYLQSALFPEAAQISSLEQTLQDILETCRSVWPKLELPAAEFLPYLAQRFPLSTTVEHSLLRIRAADLYLACACVQGHPIALASFQETYAAEVQATLKRFARTAVELEDMKQVINSHLFVGDISAAPKLIQYSGFGDLRSWLRVITVRKAINHLRRDFKEEPLDNVLTEFTAPDQGQETAYMRRLRTRTRRCALCRSIFRRAT